MTWWTRLVIWLARKPIAELESRLTEQVTESYERGWDRGVLAGHERGWNAAIRVMRQDMEAAKAEVANVRALLAPPPGHRSSKGERVH